MDLRKTVRLSMLLSLSIVLSLIESMIPIINGIIPGIKLGLANAIIILVLYLYGFKDAFFISITRVFLIGIIRTGLFNIIFFFSLSGALLSIIFMAFSKRFIKLSIVGVSIIGSVMHSIGQIIIAIIYLDTINIIYYLPYLFILSIPTGIIIGLIAKKMLNAKIIN
ncbi:MAG: Gx transporter family protein [Bacilli bacterium]|jgi:heptaprenyl diphosphate synthase|nr:Gx transporter family protein [Bacilli bacterium]